MTGGYFVFLECLEIDAYLNKLEGILLAEFADSKASPGPRGAEAV